MQSVRLKLGLATFLLSASAVAQAYDGWTSELSHAAGGALLAAGISHLYQESPNRAWIGFAASTAASVLVEGASIARGGKRSSQVLDMASHALGSALGAWYADKYLLVPVVTRHTVSLTAHYRF